MSTAIIVIILLAVVALAIKSVIHRIRHGSACCGERDAPEKKVKIQDKNKANYSFSYDMQVDGMHCSNCVRHVENALNSNEGIWAKASLEEKKVTILAKEKRDIKQLEKIVADAGYTPLETKLHGAD